MNRTGAGRRLPIMIVAGEPSADRYGARLVQKLRSLPGNEDAMFFGTGGDNMEQAGVHLCRHVRELASIGPHEALYVLRKYYATYRDLIRISEELRPAVAVLLDFPDFNLRLAKRLKRSGIKVVYYISPQLWAWRRGRIRLVRRYVDKMLVILPFEEEYYRSRGVSAEYVGHPLLEDFAPNNDRKDFQKRLGLDPDMKVVAILPGSRKKEVHHMLPTLLEAGKIIARNRPVQFLVSASAAIDIGYIRRISLKVLGGQPDAGRFRIVSEDARNLLANADFAFVKSGTSTLEAALVGVPYLIVYRISSISWCVGRALVRSRLVGLANLIAGEEIAPEFLQGDATPESLAKTALEYLEDPGKCALMKSRLSGIREILGARCASDTAAAIVDKYLKDGENS